MEKNYQLSLFNQQDMLCMSLLTGSFQVYTLSNSRGLLIYPVGCLLITVYMSQIGSAFGTRERRRFTYTGKVNLHAGTNRIALLSVAVGLPVSSSYK